MTRMCWLYYSTQQLIHLNAYATATTHMPQIKLNTALLPTVVCQVACLVRCWLILWIPIHIVNYVLLPCSNNTLDNPSDDPGNECNHLPRPKHGGITLCIIMSRETLAIKSLPLIQFCAQCSQTCQSYLSYHASSFGHVKAWNMNNTIVLEFMVIRMLSIIDLPKESDRERAANNSSFVQGSLQVTMRLACQLW